MNISDLLVIGAGPGGYTTAAEAAASGQSVTLIERDLLGGTCLNRGCIPTKCLCRSAGVMLDTTHAASLGISLPQGTPVADLRAMVQRKAQVLDQLRQMVALRLKDVNVVYGNARFTDPNTVEVGDQLYTAPKIIVATGSQPALLPIPGAGDCLTSDTLLDYDGPVPESMVIIGGGVIGVEFASVFAAFGSKVTVVEYCREILPQFDADIAKRLRMALKKRGINILTSAKATAVTDCGHTLHYECKGKEADLKADMVVMAVGRRPCVPQGLEAFACKGALKVEPDMHIEGAPEGLYAVGDVNALCMLAHAAESQGAVALGHKVDLSLIPSAVFSVPECAMVGLTEQQCQSQGIDAVTGTSFFRANGKALAMDETEGLVKFVADASDGRLLGCHIIGAHAADLIQEATMAIRARFTAADLLQTVHPHPTLSEVLLYAARAVKPRP